MIIHTFNTYHFVSCINIILILIYNCYNEDVYLPMELYYLCIDFVFQFIVEKYRNKLNQIKYWVLYFQGFIRTDTQIACPGP